MSKWDASLGLALLSACFAAPLLLLRTQPEYLALAAVAVATGLHWWSTSRSADPFLSTERVGSLALLVYANAAAYGLSLQPALPTLSWQAGAIATIYLAAHLKVIVRAWHRITDIDLEYFRYSLPSKRLTVDVGRRSGRLDQGQAALRLQLFVKEGLQFRRLSRAARLLMVQSWMGLGFYCLFGLHEPWHLLVFLANSLAIAASASSIASRATLHPGQPFEAIADEPDLYGDEDLWE